MVSQCNRIASLVILNYKIFLGEVPQTPLSYPPPSCRQHSENTNGVQWPYHFLKADDGPDQDQQKEGPDLDPKRDTLIVFRKVFFEKVYLEKSADDKVIQHAKSQSCQERSSRVEPVLRSR